MFKRFDLFASQFRIGFYIQKLVLLRMQNIFYVYLKDTQKVGLFKDVLVH